MGKLEEAVGLYLRFQALRARLSNEIRAEALSIWRGFLALLELDDEPGSPSDGGPMTPEPTKPPADQGPVDPVVPFAPTPGMRVLFASSIPIDWSQQFVPPAIAYAAAAVAGFRVRMRVRVGELQRDQIHNFVYLLRDRKRDRAKGEKPADVLAQVDVMRGGNWAVRQRIGLTQNLEAAGGRAVVDGRVIELDLHQENGEIELEIDGEVVIDRPSSPPFAVDGRIVPIFGSGPDEGFPHAANVGFTIEAVLVEFRP